MYTFCGSQHRPQCDSNSFKNNITSVESNKKTRKNSAVFCLFMRWIFVLGAIEWKRIFLFVFFTLPECPVAAFFLFKRLNNRKEHGDLDIWFGWMVKKKRGV